MQQMAELHARYHGSVIGVQNVPKEDTRSYGIVATHRLKDKIHEITSIVEKPAPENAPSTLGVVGRYILSPRIFHYLEAIQPGAGGEIQLTDAIAALLLDEQVLAYEFNGIRYDCGSKLGYLKATVVYALKHPEVSEEFKAYLASHHNRERDREDDVYPARVAAKQTG